jgi:hypothetical protein
MRFVDMHRLDRPVRVDALSGVAWRVNNEDDDHAFVVSHLSVGEILKAGEKIALEAKSVLEAEGLELHGGRRGKVFVLLGDNELRGSPSRLDVPKLLDDLAAVEAQLVARVGIDPLSMQNGPISEFDRAVAADFARQNLVLEEAAILPERVARAQRAVVLFTSGDAACVAVTELSVAKMRTLMEALGRPINPHMVDLPTLDLLDQLVYGPQKAERPS